MAGMRGNSSNRGVLVAMGGVWAIGVVGVLLFVGEEEGLLRSDRRIVAMQGSRGRMEGLSRAIAGLNAEDKRSSLMLRRGFRTSQLAAAQSEAGLNWLEKIQGKENTYDLNYIKSLPAGDTSVAGYEGMPKMKGMLPSKHELSAAEALLKSAISSNTMPADVTNVWDGQPYVPSAEFNAKVTKAWAGFHQAMGEKKWEKMVQKCPDAAHCEPLLNAKKEGYETKWDGTEWTQWNGDAWVPLEHDSLV